MAVYEISSSYRENGIAGEATFKGFFVLNEESQELRGYLEPQNPLMHARKRYIYGVYEKHNDILSYFQLSDSSELVPLMFMFFNSKKNGIWGSYDSDMDTFFPLGKSNGTAKVAIKEITTDVEKISRNTLNIFTGCTDLISNITFLYKGVRAYLNIK